MRRRLSESRRSLLLSPLFWLRGNCFSLIKERKIPEGPKLRDQGMSHLDIGKKLDISKTAVGNLLSNEQ
jgi:hypothetical protein